MKYLIGEKIAMTQVFRDDGTVVPATEIKVEPCTVAAVKQDQNGQAVAIIGSGHVKKPLKSEAKQFGEHGAFAILKQVLVPADASLEAGQVLTVSTFAIGDKIDVIGVSKGKGFQGVVKRHGFAGHPTTHGHKDQVRKSGSIGAGGIQRVFKGMRMAGRTGTDQITVKNLEVVAIDTDKNTLSIKGAIPGARGSQVTLRLTDGNVWHK